MQRVLVTDAEQRSSLAVVRSLGRSGYHVEACSTRSEPLAGVSRFCRAVHTVADPTSQPEAFRNSLLELVSAREIDVLLPMTDVTASLVLELRRRRPDLVIPFPLQEVWETVSDKRRLMDIARSLGVPTPRQQVVHAPEADLDSALSFADEVGFPVIVKPHRSAVVAGGEVIRFGVRAAITEADLTRALSGFPEAAFPVLVQERIQGPGLGGFFLSREGQLVQSFAHRRLREKPPTGGVSVLRESVDLREDIARYSAALLHHFRWSGVAMVEFKEDSRTGTPYLMEINGRFWGSLQLAIDSGVDFPRELLASFGDGDRAASPPQSTRPASARPYRIGVRTRWFWGDVDHLLWILKARRGYRDIHPELPSRLGALARFALPWRPGLRYEVLGMSDLRPFLRESRQWLAHVLLGRPPR